MTVQCTHYSMYSMNLCLNLDPEDKVHSVKVEPVEVVHQGELYPRYLNIYNTIIILYNNFIIIII